MGDVRLRLTFEKPFVPALAKTRGSIDNEFGVGCEWDAAVTGQIETGHRFPLRIRVGGADLQMNQIVLATVMFRHCGQCFPIDTLFIDAEPSPSRLVLET